MDKITISDLEVFYRVGVTEAERSKPQRLLITVEMTHDLTRAAMLDDLRETIDYAAVCHHLLHFGKGSEWNLIETLAAEIAVTILEEFSAMKVFVEVKKFIIPQAHYVSVSLTRSTK